MESDSMFEILKNCGITNKEEYIAEAFSRNIGLLTKREQKKLSSAKVAIPGMGGVGGIHLITMVRTGICNFNIADFDIYEAANINRQFGARVPDFGRPKLEVMKEQALSINPYLEFSLFEEGINDSNIDVFLDGVDVVIDGLDFFKFNIRRLLFNKAKEKGIHVITAAPLGFSSALLVFAPDKGMGFDEYFNITQGMEDKDKYLAFAMGLAPRPTHIKYMDLKKVDLDSKAGPSLNIACQICSGFAATEAVKIILKKGKVKPVPHYIQYDPYLQKLRNGYLFQGNRNPLQRIKLVAVKYLLGKNKKKIQVEIPQRPIEDISDQANISKKIINYLIRAGIQAPSGDNAQPWGFKVHNNQIDVMINKKKDMSFFNVNQIASLISCGAVIENIKIAASSFGINATTKYADNNNDTNLIASINLSVDEISEDGLSGYIWKRHTNRKLYKKKHASSSILQKISSSINECSEAKLSILTGDKDLRTLAGIVYSTDRIRTEHKPLHEHLMQMIRFNNTDIFKKKDGLPLKNLEAGFAGEIFLKLTKPWTVMNALNKVGVARLVAFHSYQCILNSSGVALLTVNGSKKSDFISGGRALERLWLTISSLGLVMQPMTAITLFYMRWLLYGLNDFQKPHQGILEKYHDSYLKLFPELKNKNRGQIMLFRFGFADDIRVQTLREDLEKFISV